jgi:hypothetical protein
MPVAEDHGSIYVSAEVLYYPMKWMEIRMRKRVGMLAVSMRVRAVNVRQDGNYEDTESETDDRNGEQSHSETDEAE